MSAAAPRATPLAEPAAFAAALAAWFAREGRDYPWRRTHEPYAILVSEMMLQQTTIAMVLERGHYARWMDAFPTPAALAAAEESRVLALWEGLGYYNRARNLQRAARVIVDEHGGVFPRTLDGVRALPGVGRYTAGAVMSFAYDAPEPLVDGNVARVFARLFDFRSEIDSPAAQARLWEWAAALVPAHGGRVHNSALMELGQRVCTPGVPTCLLCPVRAWCAAEEPAALPLKKPRRDVVHVEEDVFFCLSSGKVLLHQEQGSRRRGLWKLPPVEGRAAGALLWQGKYTITHHRVVLRVFAPAGDISAGEGEEWFTADEISALPMPSPFRKALAAVLAVA